MIGHLKFKCGTQFTSMLEGMINDFVVAADLQKSFKVHYSASNASSLGNMDFCMDVLTSGNWPTFKAFETMRLSPEMANAVNIFQSFYEDKTGGARRISWMYSLGQVSLKAVFGGSCTYEILVTTLQAAVLLYFAPASERRPKSLDELLVLTNLPVEVLKRVMDSLSCRKHRVLLRNTGDVSGEGGEKKGIAATDNFTVNQDFR